ncbi:PREDICTED: odorant receptor 13a-like [Vollenhovia emeryi]|uniref:odorant receptor 13a-like n=1 Tax=Vollenhovia emeryi TaxID=411798 RepID=UPI0005F4CE54|nr:PREDICTED: odorant receptor 13a-like [Vollenhovia emeryi]
MPCVGIHLQKRCTSFPPQLEYRTNVQTLIFCFFLHFKNYWQMITSTVSPVLKFGLRFLGIWPDASVYSNVYWFSFMISILMVQYFQYLYIFQHLKISELSNLIDCLIVTLDYSLTVFKLIGLWIQRRVFHQILADMDNDWRECINTEHLSVMTIKANISHFICNALFGINTFIGALYLLGDYVIHFVLLTEDYNVTLRQLPIKLQLPFETQRSPIFELLIIAIFVQVMLHVCTFCTLNGLILTLVLHVSGQIDIMCHELKNVSKNALFHESTLSLFQVQIERHKKIISFSKNIESLFSFFAFMQVFWNTLVICCLGFIIIFSIHNKTGTFVLIKTSSGYFVAMTEAFIICFAGEYLSMKGKLIANAIYEMMWYDMLSSQSKIIIFIIMRCQKRLTITAGKMMDMSFETFTSIIKASASYISVLNAMY